MSSRDSGRTGTPQFGVVNDRYELVEIIGSGGMGVVYRGRDRVLDRTVAVKMIREELANDEFVRRFEREAAILARLRSPHIVVVYDYGQHEGTFFLVTDYLADGDLQGWMQANGPMPAAQAVPLVAQLAEGLADAHGHGVIHRDIKPGNTLLWRRGSELRPVLADFGIAVVSDLSVTATGGVAGSPQYMAPERHLGRPATVETDIYAMGCLLYALLVGQPPFSGTQFQMANAHLNDPVPALPSAVPHAAEIDRVIADCLAKDPDDRISSAAELAERLHRVARLFDPPQPEAAPPASPPTHEGSADGAPTTVVTPVADTREGTAHDHRSGRGRVALAALAVVVVVVLTAGAWWALAEQDEDPDSPADADPSSVTSDPPEEPGLVRARATADNLAVRITAQVPPPSDGVRFRLERDDKGWRPVRSTFTMPTRQGGQQVCATLRLVAVEDAAETPGPAKEVCGRAEPRTVELRQNPAPCTYLGTPCDWVDIAMQGFRPGQSYRLTWKFEEVDEGTGTIRSTDPSPSVPRTVDSDGTAFVEAHVSSGGASELCPAAQCPGGIPAPAAATRMIVTVLSSNGSDVVLERTFDLDAFR